MAPPGVCVAIEVPCTWPCFVHKLKGNVCAAKCMASGPSFVKSFLKPEKKGWESLLFNGSIYYLIGLLTETKNL